MSEQEKAMEEQVVSQESSEEEVLNQEVSEEEQEEIAGRRQKADDWCYLLPDYTPHPCWNNSVRNDETEEKQG